MQVVNYGHGLSAANRPLCQELKETIRVAEKGCWTQIRVAYRPSIDGSRKHVALGTCQGDEKVGDSEKVVEKWGMYKDSCVRGRRPN